MPGPLPALFSKYASTVKRVDVTVISVRPTQGILNEVVELRRAFDKLTGFVMELSSVVNANDEHIVKIIQDCQKSINDLVNNLTP